MDEQNETILYFCIRFILIPLSIHRFSASPPHLKGFQPQEHSRPGISRDHVGLRKAAKLRQYAKVR